MIGTKFFKDTDIDWEAYSECAQWANANGAQMVEYDDRYECVAIESPVKSLDELKADKLEALERSFDEHVSGSFVCSMGWPMQFDRSDCVAVQGAVTLLEARGLSAGYLTDALDVSHGGVPLASIKAVLIEMLAAYADAHSAKQSYRAAISACTSQGELDGITFDWE